MKIIKVTFDFDCEGFEDLDDESKVDAVESMLNAGAESTNSTINVRELQVIAKLIKDGKVIDMSN